MKEKRKEIKNAPAEMGTGGAQSSIDTDPFGSYTGRPDDPYEQPVHDADDL